MRAQYAQGQGYATEALAAIFAWVDPRIAATTCIIDPANAPLVQIPGTGVIWKITCVSPKCGAGGDNDDNHDD